MKIVNDLNKQQKEAVLQTEGPLLILAGAGSGKTKTLTQRVVYLICEKNIQPENILGVTFTNKAANEMKERVRAELARSKCSNCSITSFVNKKQFQQGTADVIFSLPWMGTFHSICVKILRREIHHLGFENSFTIYDQTDSLSLIKTIMKELGIDVKANNPRAVRTFISGAKNELISAKDYASYAESYFQENVGKIYQEYQKRLKKANALDFDDLLVFTVKLFENKEILEKYQEIFHYILVDEYQDTNEVQYRLVKKLAEKRKNICVVGDDWQSIYGFRGANFRNILNFERDYPQAKVVKLEENYRSTANILNAANAIIKNNKKRSEKTLWTKKEAGSPIVVYEAEDQHDEIRFVIDEIEGMLPLYKTYDNFVILYRTNAQSRVIEEVLLERGAPYRIVGAVEFYQRKEIKDILAYLKLIANLDDEVALARIINVPTRGIGAKTQKQIPNFKLQIINKFQITNSKLQKFVELIQKFQMKSKELTPADLIEYVAEESEYKKMILDGTDEGEGRWENIEELKSVAQKYTKLEDFLQEISLISDVDNYDVNAERITLMTMHNAKGLEFPVVFIVGAEEGLFPHVRSLMEPMEMEEERRLAYVGVTRAKERLYMTYAQSRMIYGNIQNNISSRFIDEIPEEYREKI